MVLKLEMANLCQTTERRKKNITHRTNHKSQHNKTKQRITQPKEKIKKTTTTQQGNNTMQRQNNNDGTTGRNNHINEAPKQRHNKQATTEPVKDTSYYKIT